MIDEISVGLSPGALGGDVEELHRLLTAAGAKIARAERERKEFGPSTTRALRALQRRHGVSATGEVDAATYEVLIAVDASITIEEAGAPPTGSTPDVEHGAVKVLLVDEDGEPIAACRVVLFAQSVRSEERLAERTTHPDGTCEFTYRRPRPLSLIVRAYDAAGAVIASSGTQFAAAAHLEIAITTAANGVVRTPSKLTKLKTAVRIQLGDLPLTSLEENSEFHELQFLASAAQLTFSEVAQLYIAEELSAQHGIRTETLFGLFAEAVPAPLGAALANLPEAGLDEAFCAQVLSGVLAASDEALQRALANAVSDITLPASYAAAQAGEIALLDALRVAAVGSASFLSGKTSLTDVLAASSASETAQRAFVSAFAASQGQLAATWTTLESDANVSAGDLTALQTTVSLAELLRGNLPVLTDTLARLAAGTLTGIEDLAKLSEADWVARITAVDPDATSIPPVLPDETAEQRIARVAKAWAARFTSRYPTIAFTGALSTAADSSFAAKDELAAFFAANPSFDLRATGIDQFLSDSRAAFSASALSDLKTAQRLFRLVPRYAAVDALHAAGYGSAQSIYFAGRTQFVTAMTAALGSALSANLAYGRAQVTYTTALATYGSFNSSFNPRIPVLGGPPTAEPTADVLPDLAVLLGSLDYFACADCQSVYSPAAYLVDLLQYLAQFTTSAATLATAREAFLDRRPDVQYTALDCANSEITIPYIDLVNELLEAVIAPPPAGTVIDTLGTSAERRAVPQQVSLAAYGSAGTNGASFPLNLPFDLGFAQTQAYSAGLGVASGTALGRADVLTVLGGPTPLAGLAVTIAAARLGINPAMLAIIDSADTVHPWVRWGWPAASGGNPVTATDPDTRLAVTGAWSDVLAAVPVLLNATGLSLPELYQLLEAEWVTESTVTLRLGVDATTNTITADTEKMTFTGLTCDVLDRANRFLRLLPAAGLSMWELDWALTGGPGSALDDDFIVLLAGAITVTAQLGLPFQEALSLWLPLETRDVVNHLTDEDTVAQSTYTKVFRNPAVLNSAAAIFVPLGQVAISAATAGSPITVTTAAPDGFQTGQRVTITGVTGVAANGTWTVTVTSPTTFTLANGTPPPPAKPGQNPPPTATGTLSGIAIETGSAAQNAITAALGLSATDTAAILTSTGVDPSLTLDALNVLLQYQRLGAALSLSITDLILWIELTATTPAGAAPGVGPADTLEFCRRLAVLRKTGLGVRDLDYLLRAQSSSMTSLAFTPAQAAAVLQAVRDALAKLPAPVTIAVAGASGAGTPVTITTRQPSGLQSGAEVTIAGVQGNTAANGTWAITVVTPTTFMLDGSVGDGAWVQGTGTISTDPYDPATIQTIVVAALTAATGASAKVVTPVLTATGVLPLAGDVISALLGQTAGVDPTAFPALIAAFTRVAKAAAVYTALRPTDAEWAFAVANAGSFGWLDFSTLPLTATPDSSYPAFEALLRAFALNQRQQASAPKLFDILATWVTATPVTVAAAISGPTIAIVTASASSPIVVTTAVSHGLSTGAEVTIGGVAGNPSANGTFTATVTATNSLTLDGTAGAGNGTGGTISEPYLASALNGTVADALALATALEATAPSLIAADRPGSLADMALLTSLASALDLAGRFGIDGTTLVSLGAADASPDSANAAMAALQGRYPQSQWLSAIQPIEDGLRVIRRDALVAFILQPVKPAQLASVKSPLLTTDDLYDYYLIDPEMGTQRVTTRLLQASLAVQQFMQQCFLNLTFNGVTIDTTSGPWQEWAQWRQTFELWQAARKVFLYPENYLLPELRNDVSPFFSDLESDLRQNSCDEALAETALQNYLRKLLSVANLQVAAVYNQALPDGSYVLHVFAQTTTTPTQWFYRTRTGLGPTGGSWSPWQSLTVDIGPATHLLPVVWDRRLYLFWPVFKKLSYKQGSAAIPSSTTAGGAASAAREFWSVELCLSELSAGQWQPKQTLAQKMYFLQDDLHTDFQGDPCLLFTFRAAEADTAPLQISVYWGPGPTYLQAQASLAMLEAPLAVTEDKSLLPPASYSDGSFIDTSQETTYQLITPSENLPLQELYAPTPDNYDFVGQNLAFMPWTPPALAAEQEPTWLVVMSETSAGSVLSPTTLPLLQSVCSPAIVVPSQESQWDSTDPFFVSGIAGGTALPGGIGVPRTYLVQPSFYATTSSHPQLTNLANASQWSTAFTFQTFYHPYARTFLRELEVNGLDDLMAMQLDPETVRAAAAFDFTDYAPVSPPVTMPYPGPGNPDDPGESALDFTPADAGAFASYNWEVFCHAVRFTSTLLLQNNQFSDALKWLGYIFSPTAQPNGTNTRPQCYWGLAPLNALYAQSGTPAQITTLLQDMATQFESGNGGGSLAVAINAWAHDPYDANAVASLRPSAYGVATIMQYLSTLLAWGDYYYNQYTTETVAQAEQLYVLADMILGPRPNQVRLPPGDENAHTTYTYAQLQAQLDPFSNALVSVENLILAPEAPQAIVDDRVLLKMLPHFPGLGTGTVIGTGKGVSEPQTLLFCIPPNPQLLSYWDQVELRLSNIRAGLNLQGQAVPLPLYGPSINPLDLAEGAAGGVTPPAPIYRFSVYLQRALDVTRDVQAYGGAILAALEKHDAEALAALRATQEVNVQNLLIDVKTQQVTAAADEITVLQNQQAVVQQRHDFYAGQGLMNAWEAVAITLQTAALVSSTAAGVLDLTAGGASMAPDVQWGMAGFGGTPFWTDIWGGRNVASSATSAASMLRTLAGILTESGSISATLGGYQHRSDEWTFQANQATAELAQIASQITAANDRLTVANSELTVQSAQADNAQAVSDFLTQKFTTPELYTWMAGQLTTVYAQAYQLAYSLALQAQYAYQYELGSPDSFIEFGYWDSQRKGLTAGDSLLFDLRRMEAQYLAGNARELELTKHVSLALTQPMALIMLREAGFCQIYLNEALFDADHPGHYFRRLRSVAVTVPCVTGPYTGVNGTLTLTSAYLRGSAPGAGYPYNGPFQASAPGDDPAVAGSPVAAAGAQTIATSTGQMDAGLFEVNLRDERWLPFEGQGAISAWTLELDPRDNNFDLSTISDVILHVRYTARGGGDQTAAAAVRSSLAKPPPNRSILVSVRSTFPDALYAFFNPGPGATEATLTLPLTPEVFPFANAGTGTVQISAATFYFALNVSSQDNGMPASSSNVPGALTLTPTTGDCFVNPATGESESLTTSLSFNPALAAPQTLALTIQLADIPTGTGGLATTTAAGQTLFDPAKFEDILLVLTYTVA